MLRQNRSDTHKNLRVYAVSFALQTGEKKSWGQGGLSPPLIEHYGRLQPVHLEKNENVEYIKRYVYLDRYHWRLYE